MVTGLFVNLVILFLAGSFFGGVDCFELQRAMWRTHFFGGQGRPCPLLEYMKEELGFNLIVIFSFLWWLILPAFLVIPGVGYLIGRLRN
jgi:hypothetical protein